MAWKCPICLGNKTDSGTESTYDKSIKVCRTCNAAEVIFGMNNFGMGRPKDFEEHAMLIRASME